MTAPVDIHSLLNWARIAVRGNVPQKDRLILIGVIAHDKRGRTITHKQLAQLHRIIVPFRQNALSDAGAAE